MAQKLIQGEPIVLDITQNGGGQLVITNNPNDNRVSIEGFSRDGNGHADANLITGRHAKNIPVFFVLADKTRFSGDIETDGDIRLANAGCAVIGKALRPLREGQARVPILITL